MSANEIILALDALLDAIEREDRCSTEAAKAVIVELLEIAAEERENERAG